MGEWKERKKEERKEEKNPLFHPQNGCLPLSREKKEIPRTPVFPRDKEEKRKGKKEERDGFRDEIFKKGFRGKRMEERKGKGRKNALFQSFRDCLSLSRRKKKSSGFKGRRKRKKMKCLAWRMGYLGAG